MGPIASIADLVTALRRQAWLIVLILILGLPAAYFYAKTRPNLYEAVAVIQIEAPQVAETLTGPTSSRVPVSAQFELIQQTLMSRDVIAGLAARFDLFPEAKTPAERIAWTRGAIAIARLGDPAQAGRPDAPLTGLSITVRLVDPVKAADLANALLEHIVEDAATRARLRTSRTLEILAAEETRIGAAIADIEGRIADFRSTNVMALPEGLTGQRERLSRLQESLLELDLEVIAARGASDRLLPEEAERQLALLEEERAPLLAAIAETEAALSAAPAVERELGAMTRALGSLEAELAVIITRRTEAAMNETLEAQAQAGRFVPLETAEVPIFPVSSDKRKTAIVGGGAVLALALGLGLAREVMQPAIRTAVQLQRLLGLQPLVVIPLLRTRARARARMLRRLGLLAVVLTMAGTAVALEQRGLQAVLDALPRDLLTFEL